MFFQIITSLQTLNLAAETSANFLETSLKVNISKDWCSTTRGNEQPWRQHHAPSTFCSRWKLGNGHTFAAKKRKQKQQQKQAKNTALTQTFFLFRLDVGPVYVLFLEKQHFVFVFSFKMQVVVILKSTHS